ncbi:MAG: metalloregulator ArsR/SmtB family transcription factor [Chloroflexota bacterium]|nr:metalloregulator ArsR/SmtB family transcription factor [Chloroflexota bacterium]
MNKQPNITWEKGSAYDLFVSLRVLHNPDKFGLRPSWAAGVRSRLPTQLRDVLETSQKFLKVPLSFIHSLPAPKKDVATALAVLEALSPEDRLSAMFFGGKNDPKTQHDAEFLSSLAGKQRLTASMAEQIRQTYTNPQQVTKERVRAAFEAWSDQSSFGDKFVQALKSFTKSFFNEEETRIIPAQSKALNEAQILAAGTDILSLLEKLSAGVRMDWITGISNLILAPSFWGAPFVFFDKLDEETGIILFGSRPKGMTLVPGDLVPEDLLNALKALADPTRLRILRYLLEGPRSPSELAKILRLRPPTVVHHLYNLRLAGLVLVTVSPRAERRYAVRMDGINSTVKHLNAFLSGD